MLDSVGIDPPILVTGATGFIGRRLVDRLVQDGFRPRILVLPDDQVPPEWDGSVEVLHGDVTERAGVADAVRETRTVFHLAAVVSDWGDAALHERVTVRGTEHVLGEAVRTGAHVVLASSLAVYGDGLKHLVCNEDTPFGTTFGPYSRSKQAQETIARRLERHSGLLVTIIRPTNVFGPGSVFVENGLKQLRLRRPTLIDGGMKCANLAYVDNVVDVFVRAAERPASAGRVYNASDDSGATWRAYFTDLARFADLNPPWSIPHGIANLFAVGLETGGRVVGYGRRPAITREALNLMSCHDRMPIDRARTELGYEPIVSYADGMAAVASYLAERSF